MVGLADRRVGLPDSFLGSFAEEWAKLYRAERAQRDGSDIYHVLTSMEETSARHNGIIPSLPGRSPEVEVQSAYQ